MNIFLDCGFYAGGALKKYIDDGMVDSTWTIYAFEPNTDLNTEEQIRVFEETHNVKINLIRKAVWTKGGTITFHIAGRDDAAGIKDLTGHTSPKEIIVPTINFPKFVKALPEGRIICSMDIEGAEYRVLKKMLQDDSINRFEILDVEFHHRFMNDFTHLHSQRFIDQIVERGVRVELKVELQ